MSILDDIFAHKRDEVARRKQIRPPDVVRAEAQRAAPPRDVIAALHASRTRPALIAEIKRASPSQGLLAADLDPLRLARTYQQNGAAAISVLTDERFFQGCLDDLDRVRQEVSLPVLRKDFILDPYQVYESRAAGADAVLLIAAMLSDEDLQALYGLIDALGMTALVEVHDEMELERALRLEPRLLGINNRDLRTFRVDLETTARLRPLIPAGLTVVAESGVHTRRDAASLARVGADAILVGESLVTARDPAARVRELAHPYTRVKICGITTLQDAVAAAEAGADMLGFNFYPHSKRYLTPQACARIVSQLTRHAPPVTRVGVFVNSPLQEVASILDLCGLDLAQLHGDEPPEFVAACGAQAFKGIRPNSPDAAESDARRYARPTPPALLVDACQAGLYGGTGQTGDWAAARALAAEHALLLAGGLNPENVAAAVAQVQPWGVDVASGIESSPGRKDPLKMAAFVRQVRACAAPDEAEITTRRPTP